MINELLESGQFSRQEYYEALRLVVSDDLKNAPIQELEYEIDTALEQMSVEEVEEFWGAITGIATSILPKVAKGIGSLFSRKRRRCRRRRTVRYRRRRVSTVRSGLTHLLKVARDPRFLSLIAGNLLNRARGQRIGRVTVRRVRRSRGGRREVTDVSLSEFLSLFSFLKNRLSGGRNGLSSSVSNESFEYDVNETAQAESLLQTLYGNENTESFDSGIDEFDEFGDFNEFEGADEFAGLETEGAFDEFDRY